MGESDILRSLFRAETRDALFDLLGAFFRSQGFGSFYYVVPSLRDPLRFDLVHHEPQAWIAKYQEANLDFKSSILGFLARSGRPLRVSQISEAVALTAEQQDFLATAWAGGMTDGWLIPTFGPHKQMGLFGISDIEHEAVLEDANVAFLQSVAQAAQTKLDQLQPIMFPPKIAPREVEILHWIARGKSNGEISEILDIRPPTVATHVKRLFGKLDVHDRAAAAARGIKLGIVHL